MIRQAAAKKAPVLNNIRDRIVTQMFTADDHSN